MTDLFLISRLGFSRQAVLCICVLSVTASWRFTLGQMSPDIDPVSLARQSTFVFHGTVQKAHATTTPLVVPSGQTVIVRVDAVIRSPESLTGYGGKEVTVQLLQPDSLKEGVQALFFTQGWIIGPGVAVKEVSHSISLKPDDAKAMLLQADKQLETQSLRNQLAAAPLVITGEVTRVQDILNHGDASEHDPHWQDATIAISSVEKGSSPSKIIHVLFPTSRDIAWSNAPRFQAGQKGIWILNKVPGTNLFKGLAPAGRAFTALSNSDFRSLDQIDIVRTLVK
jgi:hypothetical protein